MRQLASVSVWRTAGSRVCIPYFALLGACAFLHAMPHAQTPCGLQADMPGRPHSYWIVAMHAQRSPCSGRSRCMHNVPMPCAACFGGVLCMHFLHAMPHALLPCGLQADMPGRPHPYWIVGMHAQRSPCSGRSRWMHNVPMPCAACFGGVLWRPDVLILRRVLHALRHLYYTTGCAHAASPCPHGPQNQKGDFYNGRQPALRRRCGQPLLSFVCAAYGQAWQSSLSPFTHQGRLFARAIIQLHFSGHCG